MCTSLVEQMLRSIELEFPDAEQKWVGLPSLSITQSLSSIHFSIICPRIFVLLLSQRRLWLLKSSTIRKGLGSCCTRWFRLSALLRGEALGRCRLQIIIKLGARTWTAIASRFVFILQIVNGMFSFTYIATPPSYGCIYSVFMEDFNVFDIF